MNHLERVHRLLGERELDAVVIMEAGGNGCAYVVNSGVIFVYKTDSANNIFNRC